jgi:hypothetical protein
MDDGISKSGLTCRYYYEVRKIQYRNVNPGHGKIGPRNYRLGSRRRSLGNRALRGLRPLLTSMYKGL